jgi:NitT/TauT family transport system permease protein
MSASSGAKNASASPPKKTAGAATARRILFAAAPFLFGALFLISWELFVRLDHVPYYVLPGPVASAEAFVGAVGPLTHSLLITLKITLLAFIAAALSGLLLGILFSSSRFLERTLFPYAVMLQVTPIVAIAPLIIIWANDTQRALLICAWLVAFFPVLSNTVVGMNSTDRNLLDLFKLYGMSPLKTVLFLKFPNALPFFLAGLRISGGLALIGAVVAEFVAGAGGSGSGLAYSILDAGYRLQIPRMFAALFLISVVGILIFVGLSALSRFLLRNWHDSAMKAR